MLYRRPPSQTRSTAHYTAHSVLASGPRPSIRRTAIACVFRSCHSVYCVLCDMDDTLYTTYDVDDVSYPTEKVMTSPIRLHWTLAYFHWYSCGLTSIIIKRSSKISTLSVGGKVWPTGIQKARYIMFTVLEVLPAIIQVTGVIYDARKPIHRVDPSCSRPIFISDFPSAGARRHKAMTEARERWRSFRLSLSI